MRSDDSNILKRTHAPDSYPSNAIETLTTNEESDVEYCFLERVRPLFPEADWDWSEHFRKAFCVFAESLNLLDGKAHQSSFFAAFDLDEGNATMKAYFFPAYLARQLNLPKIDVLASAITRLPNYSSSDFAAFEMLRDCIVTSQSELGIPLEVEMVAVDCVCPQQSHLKIYIRSRQTSLESIRKVATLGGQLASLEMDQSLTEFEALWRSLFSGQEHPCSSLITESHRTAGILYNFEIRPGCPIPVPKVYIPVRHYAHSDRAILKALREFTQRSQHGDDTKFARYREAMMTLL